MIYKKINIFSGLLFGWHTNDTVPANKGGSWLQLFDKDGSNLGKMKGDGSFYSCVASENNEFIFGGDSSSSVYCFDKTGTRLWKPGTNCGSAHLQYHKDKLYTVATHSILTCIDASNEAIEKAKKGEVPQAQNIKAPTQ